MDFPLLYKDNMTWKIHVTHEAEVIRAHGLVDGKKVFHRKRVTQGKNIGRSNQTTAYTQAVTEAESLYRHKTKQGYTVDKVRHQDVSPMLAQPFEKHGKKIVYPCAVQPKLDGVRMLARRVQGDILLTSRTGKVFTSASLNKIRDALAFLKDDTIVLDGELYSKDLTFDQISGACRNQQETFPLEYHVYDMMVTDRGLTFKERMSRMHAMIMNGDSVIRRVHTRICDTPEDIPEFHDTYTRLGYEGLMIRNLHGVYECARSQHLQKLKRFQDDEFEIVGMRQATGNDEGTALFECRTENGKVFTVRPKGSRDYRANLLKTNLIYKKLTVQFQGYTENGVPRFPVGVSVRDYE